MSAQQNLLSQQIITKAMKDDAFRQRLLSNPRETLEREVGMIIPQGVTLQMHEDTPTTHHLVLPMKPAVGEAVELSDAQLEQAVGGQGLYTSTLNAGCDCTI
jgi:Nitrile hydratase, alpha chain